MNISKDYNISFSEDILRKLEYLYKTSRKKDIKLDSSCSYQEIIAILIKELDRYWNVIGPNLKMILVKNSLYDEEYLVKLKKLNDKIMGLVGSKEDKVCLQKLKDSNLHSFIELLYLCEKTIEEMYLLEDLKASENDYLISMKYYKTPEEIEDYKKRFSRLVEAKDIIGLESLQDEVTNEIKREWQRFVTPLEAMNDDNYAFIGHSTTSTSFDGDFAHPYVSTSLFNQDLNDTFNYRYGFIFNPENILLTGIDDLFSDNDATEDQEISPFSKTSRIMHPQRLIDECLKLKQDNSECGLYEPVYNEVVIKGFNPIGLFCFTNGALEYDKAYQNVLKLKTSFPTLPLVVIDIMKRKANDELAAMELELLNSLNEMVMGNIEEILSTDIVRYQMFLDEFKSLKTKSYTKEDIAKIFKKNYKLISYSSRPSELFSGKYTSEEIKYALLYGYRYNIKKIFDGEVTKEYLLSLVRNLNNYVGRLNTYIPYLDEFVMVASHIEFTDEIISNLSAIRPCDFKKMSLYLMPILKSKLLKVKMQNDLKMMRLESTKFNLLAEQQSRKLLEDQKAYYTDINNHSWVLTGVTSEFSDTFASLDNLNLGIKNLKIKENKIEEELAFLQTNPKTGNIKVRKEALNQSLEFIQKDIKCLNEAIVHLEERLKDVRLYLSGFFGVETLKEAENLVAKATKFLDSYDQTNEKSLANISLKLRQVTLKMSLIEKAQSENTSLLENLDMIDQASKKR